MDDSIEYIGLLVTFVIAAGIGIMMYILTTILGPKPKASYEKGEPFECGVKPFSGPMGKYSVKFYLVAMFFILFDIEIIWFFPWAVLLRELGLFGLCEMFFFVGVLIMGFVYAWKNGALQWEK